MKKSKMVCFFALMCISGTCMGNPNEVNFDQLEQDIQKVKDKQYEIVDYLGQLDTKINSLTSPPNQSSRDVSESIREVDVKLEEQKRQTLTLMEEMKELRQKTPESVKETLDKNMGQINNRFESQITSLKEDLENVKQSQESVVQNITDIEKKMNSKIGDQTNNLRSLLLSVSEKVEERLINKIEQQTESKNPLISKLEERLAALENTRVDKDRQAEDGQADNTSWTTDERKLLERNNLESVGGESQEMSPWMEEYLDQLAEARENPDEIKKLENEYRDKILAQNQGSVMNTPPTTQKAKTRGQNPGSVMNKKKDKKADQKQGTAKTGNPQWR